MKFKSILLLTMLLALCLGSEAQTFTRSPQKSIVGIDVHFRHDNYTLDRTYMGNGQSLQRFAQVVDSIGIERIDSVVIVSQSSPEGVYEYNLRLSQRRANTMRSYIQENHADLNDKVFIHPDGESWQQLRQYVIEDTKLKDSTKEKILAIIDADINVGTKKWRMEQLPVYRYLLTTYYRRIRNSAFCILYYSEIPVPEPEPTPEPEPEPEPIPEPTPEPEPQPQERTLLAIKSNLLYDAVLIPNIGIEVYLGSNYSLSANWAYSWWNNNRADWWWRYYGGEVAIRRYFGKGTAKESFTGHHAGIYASMFTYDFEMGKKGYMAGIPGGNIWDKANYAAGIEYGYSLPIAGRLNIDFAIGVGYMWGEYREYKPIDGCYVWQATKSRNYFGPTKAEVSLVWLLGRGNKGHGKGGEP